MTVLISCNFSAFDEYARPEELAVTCKDDSDTITIKVGDQAVGFLGPRMALHLAHLLRVAAGAEEARTDAPTEPA